MQHTEINPFWVPIAVAVITAIPSIIAAVVSVRNHVKLTDLQVHVNGRLTELLDLTAKSSKAEGMKQEKDAPSL